MSKQRQKGTKYENRVRDHYLRRVWPTADRAPLRGTADTGDFDGTPLVVEAKKRNAWRIGEWIRTTSRKGHDVGRDWCIVFAGDKRISGLEEDYVVCTAEYFFDLHKTLSNATCLCETECFESTCDTVIEKGYR